MTTATAWSFFKWQKQQFNDNDHGSGTNGPARLPGPIIISTKTATTAFWNVERMAPPAGTDGSTTVCAGGSATGAGAAGTGAATSSRRMPVTC